MKKNSFLGFVIPLFVISCSPKSGAQEISTEEKQHSAQKEIDVEENSDEIEVFEMGKTITLKGKIFIDKVYDPLGFGENSEGEEEIKVWMFYPDKPVQFYGSDGYSDEVTLEEKLILNRLHMVCNDNIPDEYIGREVMITASTFREHTRHHRTSVLLSDCEIRFIHR